MRKLNLMNLSIATSALLVAGLLGLMVLTNCNPTAPSEVNVYNQNTNQNIQGGQPSPPPDASGSLPAGSVVKIEIFGASCPSGANPRPNPGELKVGCSLAVTATPKGPDGANLPANVHGPNCAWAVPVGSAALRVVEDGSQPFNATVLATAIGQGVVSAVVKGTTGTLLVTVVP